MSTPEEEPMQAEPTAEIPKTDESEEHEAPEPSAEEPPEEAAPEGRFARLRRRLLERADVTDEARGLLSSMWDTSDRAKTEIVRMVAREVRHYLDELKLKEDLLELATSHSLEFHASFSLKPLKDAATSDPEPEAS